jgi:hypothetical protein
VVVVVVLVGVVVVVVVVVVVLVQFPKGMFHITSSNMMLLLDVLAKLRKATVSLSRLSVRTEQLISLLFGFSLNLSIFRRTVKVC